MMLLDTHILLWQRWGDQRLGVQTRDLLQHSLREEEAAVSAISFWEVAMRIQKGQINFDLDLHEWRNTLIRQGLIEIPVDGAIAARAGLLGGIHGDPADRIIVATALGGHRLVTADQRILGWGGNLDRLDARQ